MEFVRGTTFFPSNDKTQFVAGSCVDNGSSPSPVTGNKLFCSQAMLEGDLPLFSIENLAATGLPLLKLNDHVLFPVNALTLFCFHGSFHKLYCFHNQCENNFLYIRYTTQKRGMTSIIISYFLLFYTFHALLCQFKAHFRLTTHRIEKGKTDCLEGWQMKRRRYNPYTLPRWARTARAICAQLIIPFCVFQGIRTLFFPTTFDVFLLSLFILVALAIKFEIV
jgi:hypothetical protein